MGSDIAGRFVITVVIGIVTIVRDLIIADSDVIIDVVIIFKVIFVVFVTVLVVVESRKSVAGITAHVAEVAHGAQTDSQYERTLGLSDR